MLLLLQPLTLGPYSADSHFSYNSRSMVDSDPKERA
jgi:hypothetical protein